MAAQLGGNGIVVRSIPAIHTGDGPVSFIIEYAGHKLVFGGDTSPNIWFVKYSKDADFVIHEAFGSPEFFVTGYNQPPPDKNWPEQMSDFIKAGEWGPAFNAQNKMLDEHAKKYNLQDQDWRKQKPWYKPTQ